MEASYKTVTTTTITFTEEETKLLSDFLQLSRTFSIPTLQAELRSRLENLLNPPRVQGE